MKRYTTYMWREVTWDNIYTFQTNDPKVMKRLKQRKDFWQVGNVVVGDFLVFKSRKKTPQSAKRTLSRVTNGIVKKDAKNDVFFAESNTIVANKTKPDINKKEKR